MTGATGRPATPTRGVVVAGVAVFWLVALVAGALVPGYSARADYVSSLAGRGSSVAVFGIAAIAALGIAHVGAAAVWRGAVAVPLALAGVAGLTIAAFRTACPLGAAGCGTPPNVAPADLAGSVHGLAVLGYEVALLAAMVVVAARLARTRPLAAALTVAAAVLSVALALNIGGPDLGAWQRAWLVVNTGWLVAAVLLLSPPAPRGPTAPSPWRHGRAASPGRRRARRTGPTR